MWILWTRIRIDTKMSQIRNTANSDNECIDAGEGRGAEADGSVADHMAQPRQQRRPLQRRGPRPPPTSGAVQGKYIYTKLLWKC